MVVLFLFRSSRTFHPKKHTQRWVVFEFFLLPSSRRNRQGAPNFGFDPEGLVTTLSATFPMFVGAHLGRSGRVLQRALAVLVPFVLQGRRKEPSPIRSWNIQAYHYIFERRVVRANFSAFLTLVLCGCCVFGSLPPQDSSRIGYCLAPRSLRSAAG